MFCSNSKFKAAVVFVSLLSVLSPLNITGNTASAITASDASFSIDVSFFSNYTPKFSPRPSNMSDSIFVGPSSSAYAVTHAVIPLTDNGIYIIDQDSTDNVPGLHITRKQGYVEIAAHGFNTKKSRENVKADFSFTNAMLVRAESNPLHPYEKQGNGTCGIVIGRPGLSDPANDQIRVSGNSGTLCSITSVDSDSVRIVYSVSPQNPNPPPPPPYNPPYNNLIVSCFATPNPAYVGQQISFIPTVYGGTGNYTYSWSGAGYGNNQIYATSFSQPGARTATVTVYSGTQTASAVCEVNINQISQVNNGAIDNSGVLINNSQLNNSQINTGFIDNSQNSYNQNTYYPNYQNYPNYPDNSQYSQPIVNKKARNLSSGYSNWANSVYASPSDVLMFMITIQVPQTAYNINVRDTLPYNLIYRSGTLTVSGGANYNYSGDITYGINLGTVQAGQTVTITYQAQVAGPQNFSYGTTILYNNVSVTSSGAYFPATDNVSILVTKSAVYGATYVPTGSEGGFFTGSYLFPLALALSGAYLSRPKAAAYIAQRRLKSKISLIKSKEAAA